MMTINDIKKIEQTLDITLPAKLVKTYLANETEGANEFEKLRGYFITDADTLIRLNQRLRTRGLFKKPFSKEHFAIGYAFKTNYYLIDLKDENLYVYLVMNNKTWAYRPDNIIENERGKLDFHISQTIMHIEMLRNAKRREELGIPAPAATAEETYKMLDEMWERNAQIKKERGEKW
ncbi:MAG: hypothetical protein EOM54_14340 [Clostridia bacterium]|nr:hypothetical protein [Clostridia bacterium]